MRKGAGISALSRHTITSTSYSNLSTSLSTQQLNSLQSSLSQFRESLLLFAQKHKSDIRSDPVFRYKFQQMCSAIGIDPLQSSSSSSSSSSSMGFWSRLGLGEFAYELAVQIVDVCISTRGLNGGMIEMNDLIKRIEKMRGISKYRYITSQDIKQSLKLLQPLKAGYSLIVLGEQTWIRSIPKQLDMDLSLLLGIATVTGGKLTEGNVGSQTGWEEIRVKRALENCLDSGMGWLDGVDDSVWVLAAMEGESG
ncbi:hypothetical protein TREMEDRAFT_34426 [Tremella mesenterica DSM 1558]|uniref:uncharacterized protein n=1 Tax=Tremella mesenterica (strain ATCC 24925 / CBS 8224 / DSM 1558 / NBRC 9311 / NRRL Y-6157 / RJB 2259-6 / UBC 559-6) TaxID=578456 RepID=UPI0003F4A5C5|nr:uncharacterized protein TREMEDRAFT_34426 [Tremella mesenterica DSM 1558]EIW67039.1 hypothetical protein TREMEDRAFT_34426 [Tremella mesenterica DSM 1558]